MEGKMTDEEYEKFKELIDYDGMKKEFSWHDNFRFDGDSIIKRWIIGGMIGGNCWDGAANRPISGDGEPNFKLLDMIFEKVCPNITYLQYKDVVDSCVSREDDYDYDYDYDYYGNYYTYASESCGLRTLAYYLKENELCTLK
jgi:hypothetical protein